jgi:hypothetical protein
MQRVCLVGVVSRLRPRLPTQHGRDTVHQQQVRECGDVEVCGRLRGGKFLFRHPAHACAKRRRGVTRLKWHVLHAPATTMHRAPISRRALRPVPPPTGLIVASSLSSRSNSPARVRHSCSLTFPRRTSEQERTCRFPHRKAKAARRQQLDALKAQSQHVHGVLWCRTRTSLLVQHDESASRSLGSLRPDASARTGCPCRRRETALRSRRAGVLLASSRWRSQSTTSRLSNFIPPGPPRRFSSPKSRPEATGALRGLVDAVVLSPDGSKEELGIELRGNLAAMLGATVQNEEVAGIRRPLLAGIFGCGGRNRRYQSLWIGAA